jgi:peptide/nickel transport system permease protein
MSPKRPWSRSQTPAEKAFADEAAKRYELDESVADSGQEAVQERSGEPRGFDDPLGASEPLAVQGGARLRVPEATLAGRADYLDIGETDESIRVVDDAQPLWRQMLRIFAANRLAVLSVLVLVIIVLGCYVGPHFYVTNQSNANLALSQPENLAPSLQHPLGTDNNGFDVLGRIMYAGQYSLILGLIAGLITIFVGTTYGMVSGYFGGLTDGVLMRLLDAALSIPGLFLLVALITVFHRSTTFLILVIGLTGWFGNARIIRGDALVIRDLEYSQAASSMGARDFHIIRRHVFPNSISNIVTVGTFSVADAILFLSALGFLGFGIESPGTDWGTMMNLGTQVLINGYWWETYPVAFVFVTVILCINYIGDALRDVFEVRLRQR